MSKDEKEICDCIKKYLPVWEKESDEFLINYCEAVPIVEELIGNKGYTIEQAVRFVCNK